MLQQATKYRDIRIPEPFASSDEQGRRYGGDLRIGDLDGNGHVDFVSYQSLGGIKPAFLGAFDLNGEPLWSIGSHEMTARDADGEGLLQTVSPDRPGPVAIADIDGDGACEVLCLLIDDNVDTTSKWHLHDIRLVLLDGTTGRVKQEAAPEVLRQCDGFAEGELRIPNYVHQRLLVADFSGKGSARDFVIKVGKTLVAFNSQFEVLWTYENRWNKYPRHAAYIPAVGDFDGDGRDEVNGGLFLLDHDGTVLWEEFVGDNMDSVLVESWDVASPARAIVSAGGLVLDGTGQRLFELGMDVVPHGQEIRCGRYHAECKDRELAIRYNGHKAELLVAGPAGVLSRFRVDESPNNTGLETISWNGSAGPDLIYSPAALWDGDGNRVIQFPDLPAPSGGKMGWYHCFAANVCGDEREEVILYDPNQDRVHIYTQEPPQDAFSGYQHTPRQYNARLID
jgi:hypothetical protein